MSPVSIVNEIDVSGKTLLLSQLTWCAVTAEHPSAGVMVAVVSVTW